MYLLYNITKEPAEAIKASIMCKNICTVSYVEQYVIDITYVFNLAYILHLLVPN